ncbi:MAG: hypothetical protein ACK56Q_18020 [Pirellulaceae bacterium]
MAPKRVIIHHQIARLFEVLPMREDRSEEKKDEKKEFSVCTFLIATYFCAAVKTGNCFWFSVILKRTIMNRVVGGGLLLLAMSTGCGKGWLPCLTRGDACFAPGCGLGGGMPGPQDPCNDPALMAGGDGCATCPQTAGYGDYSGDMVTDGGWVSSSDNAPMLGGSTTAPGIPRTTVSPETIVPARP